MSAPMPSDTLTIWWMINTVEPTTDLFPLVNLCSKVAQFIAGIILSRGPGF